jgi:hypothetical protein
LLNEALTVDPRVVMTVMQAITIRASITEYSTAVGPSSLRMRLRIGAIQMRIGILSLGELEPKGV